MTCEKLVRRPLGRDSIAAAGRAATAALLGVAILAGLSDGAAARHARRHARQQYRVVLEAQQPVNGDPRAVPAGLLGFDLGVLGAGISGASTALPPGYGFYGPDYHGPGFGQPGY